MPSEIPSDATAHDIRCQGQKGRMPTPIAYNDFCNRVVCHERHGLVDGLEPAMPQDVSLTELGDKTYHFP